MSCYPVIGKTNKGTDWFDMIWLWQITLITTYHFTLLRIIWNPCLMIFLGNESQISWDAVSSFFFIIGTLSAVFYPSIIQILKDNYHGLQDCSASSLSNLGWITGMNDLRKSNLSKQFLNISFAILAWVLTLLWLVLTVSAIWLQSGFLMKTEAIKGIKQFGLPGMFCY